VLHCSAQVLLKTHEAPIPLHIGLFGTGRHLPPPNGTAQFMLQLSFLHACYSTQVSVGLHAYLRENQHFGGENGD